MAGRQRNIVLGAAGGAVLVAALTLGVGAALGEVAHPAVVASFAAFGAVLGAFAWGSVSYQREHDAPAPSAAYTEGALAEPDPEPEPEPGLIWLARHRAKSLLKLPLNPWI